MNEPFVELTDDEWNARVDAIIAEHPGLFPRHAVMFVQAEEAGQRYRHNALAWEREKGRAYADSASVTDGLDVARARRCLVQASIYLVNGDLVAVHEELAVALDALQANAPDPSWTEDAEGYVIAPLDWKGAK